MANYFKFEIIQPLKIYGPRMVLRRTIKKEDYPANHFFSAQ